MHHPHLYLTCLFAIIAFIFAIIPLFVSDELIVYSIIFSWFFFPKLAIHVIGILDVPLFSYMQLMQSLCLIYLMYKHRSTASGGNKLELYANNFYLVTFAFTYTIGLLMVFWIYHYVVVFPWSWFFMNFCDALAKLVFLYACYFYIDDLIKLKNLLKLIVLFAGILGFEFVLMTSLAIAHFNFAILAFNWAGYFRSFFMNDSVAISIYCALGALLAIYFYSLNFKRFYLLIAFLCVAASAYDIIKVVLFSFMLAAALYCLLTIKNKGIKCLGVILSIIVPLLLYKLELNYLVNYVPVKECVSTTGKPLLAGDADMCVSSSAIAIHDKIQAQGILDSSYIRIGQAIRGLQVAKFIFPFGLGENMERYYVIHKPPVLLKNDEVLFIKKVNELVYYGYKRVTTEGVLTEVQIGYVSIILSYGLLGLIAALLFAFLIIRNLIRALYYHRKDNELWKLSCLVTCSLFIYACYFLYNTGPIVYIVLLSLYHATFLLAEKGRKIVSE